MNPDHASFIDKLKKLPLVRDALAETKADDLKRRECLVEDIARLDAEAAVRLPAMRKEVEASLANVKREEKRMASIYNAHNAKTLALSSASHTYQRLRDADETALADSPAAEIIDAFRRKIWDMIDAARKAVESIEGMQTGLDGRAVRFVVSNATQVHARVAALRAAADAAHALRFEADQSEIEVRLEALLRDLPKIERGAAPAAAAEPAKAPDLPRIKSLPFLKGNE